MKPLKILIFFFAVFSFLFLLSIFFPKEGIALGDGLSLRFVSKNELFQKDSVSSAYTDSLINHTLATEDPEIGIFDSVFIIAEELPDIDHDSIIRARIDSISSRVFLMNLNEDAKEELVTFFEKAEKSHEKGELLRILHYGDSQIENDRMTSLLRYRFQKVFGGSGCGMVPAIPLYSGNPTFKEAYSGEWIRYTGFGKRDSTLDHKAYGTLACFSSVPIPENSDLPSLEFNFIKGRRASRFSKVNLFLHSYADSNMIIVHVNDSISDTIAELKDGFQIVEYQTPIKAEEIKIDFNLREGGRFYGISFDPFTGIQMDNIAMRGSSGIEFRRSDEEVLDTMMQALNPGLLLMQFGGNVVPYISNVSYYKTAFKRELKYLKELCPGVSIIVIGPSDMATKENGKFMTYEKLEEVRDALKSAALETGCGFWDMYEAMGGKNSIQDFVLADPPLASSDYIHFTPRGANMMAGMFFDAVMLEYNRYRASASGL